MGATPPSLTPIEDILVILCQMNDEKKKDSGTERAGIPKARTVQLMSASLLVSLAKATATTVMTTSRIM